MGTNKLILTIVCLALVLTTVPAATLGQGSITHTVCPDGPPICDHDSIQAAIDAAAPGDAIEVAAGTYVETLYIGKEDLTLAGAGASQVIVDASGGGTRGITADASGFSLSGLTVTGADSYGVKIEISSGGPDVTDIEVRDLVIENSARSELDLHGVDRAVIQNVTANGLGTSGNGMAVTDSHNVTIEDVTTEGNTWGGIAIYTSGGFTTGGTSGISVVGDNNLAETNPLYSQTHHGHPITDLTLERFTHTVTSSDLPTFTFYQQGLDLALSFANANSFPTDTAVVQDLDAENYHVNGTMAVQPAVDAAADGASITLYEGTFDGSVRIAKPLSISSESGDGGTAEGLVTGAWSLRPGADATSITGLHFEGANIVTFPPLADVTIDHNVFTSPNNHAVITDANAEPQYEGWTIANNTVTDVQRPRNSGMYLDGLKDSSLSGNTIDGAPVAGLLVLFTTNTTIAENNITNTGNGVVLWDDEGATLTDNALRGNGAGLYIQPGATTEIVATGNTIHDNTWGIYVDTGLDGIEERLDVTAQFNSFVGNANQAVNNTSGFVMDATHNWWDSPLGPSNDGNLLGNGQAVSDDVAYGSWCLREDCTVQQINHEMNLRPHH